MKAENTTKIQFDSLSVNESYARGAAAAFLARYDPTVPQLADLKTAVQSGSIDEIKAKQDELSHVFEKMYQAAAAAQQQAAGAQPGPDAGANNQQKPGDDGVVDADFKEV